MKGFQLQRKVEGVEVAVCGFFDGERFVDRINFNFEHKICDLMHNCPVDAAT
jgi:phosphoribosylamine--glycine ligase